MQCLHLSVCPLKHLARQFKGKSTQDGHRLVTDPMSKQKSVISHQAPCHYDCPEVVPFPTIKYMCGYLNDENRMSVLYYFVLSATPFSIVSAD